ncbi:unnamed protein product [Clonostachys rosea]|uniref:Stress-response A/B barrel domain-containing protein n=1 Tax=Bionectria ochroleuca TaxID=29856 RepID=A0ABY6UD49_BIOOC|nr:unnamed protein product [Clonostachys rosea]
MSSSKIHRVTLFKIPSKEDQQRLIDIYRDMPTKALKNGKPYIISATVGPTYDDARNQGYTLAALSVFESEEDMKFYDNECSAHGDLKKVAKTLHQGAMMVYFSNVI